jgi:hypothetical protein
MISFRCETILRLLVVVRSPREWPPVQNRRTCTDYLTAIMDVMPWGDLSGKRQRILTDVF